MLNGWKTLRNHRCHAADHRTNIYLRFDCRIAPEKPPVLCLHALAFASLTNKAISWSRLKSRPERLPAMWQFLDHIFLFSLIDSALLCVSKVIVVLLLGLAFISPQQRLVVWSSNPPASSWWAWCCRLLSRSLFISFNSFWLYWISFLSVFTRSRCLHGFEARKYARTLSFDKRCAMN